MKKQISENIVKEEKDCNSKLEEISNLINSVQILKQEVAESEQDGDIDLLLKSNQRKILYQHTNGPLQKDLVNTQIPSVVTAEIKRDQEMIQISRIVHPQFKGNPN